MAPTVLRRNDTDPLRKYWWVVLLLVLAAGGGVLSMMRSGDGAGGGGAADSASGMSATEQSLDSIDQGLSSLASPGGPISLSMDGSYRRREDGAGSQKSSLYEAPGAGSAAPPGAAASVSTAGSAAGEGGSGSLAEALKSVAKRASKAENKGWGDAVARSGFSPGAKLKAMSGLGAGGGGAGSSANLAVGGLAGGGFSGGGSGPASGGTMLSGDGGSMGPPKVRKGGHNQAFDILKQVEKNVAKSAGVGSDLAANLGARGYDGASLKTAAGAPGLSGLPGAGGQVVGKLDAIPENLKLDDPKLQKKDIKVPEVGKDKDAQKTGMDMEQMMMMMLVQAAIGGIAGPMFGAVGMGIANGVFGANMKGTYNFGPGGAGTGTTK